MRSRVRRVGDRGQVERVGTAARPLGCLRPRRVQRHEPEQTGGDEHEARLRRQRFQQRSHCGFPEPPTRMVDRRALAGRGSAPACVSVEVLLHARPDVFTSGLAARRHRHPCGGLVSAPRRLRSWPEGRPAACSTRRAPPDLWGAVGGETPRSREWRVCPRRRGDAPRPDGARDHDRRARRTDGRCRAAARAQERRADD